MGDTHGFSLTFKHREDFEKVAAFVKQQVREKSLELLGEDLSVDGFVGLKIKKEKNEVLWYDFGHHGEHLDFFSIAENVIKEFPDVEMDLDSWWGGRERWTYKIVDGHWKGCEPWIICAYTENKNDYQRLRTVAKQDGIVPQYLGTKYYSELHWDYNQVKGEGTEEERKVKRDNLTRDLAEKLSRNLEDVELLLYYFNYDDYYYEINEIIKVKNGHVVTEQVDKGISVVLIEDVDSLKWINGREPLLLHPMEYVTEMIRRAREGDRDCQYCVNRILEYGDKSLYESLLTEEDKKWLDF